MRRKIIKKTNLDKFILNWSKCDLCEISKFTKTRPFYRGHIPCDFLFIGEAPGETEDLLGQPFLGRSGQLLNTIINESLPNNVRVAFCNSIVCTPKTSKQSLIIRAPNKDEIKNCSTRLSEFISLSSPKVMVAVGKKAESALKLLHYKEFLSILHPAYILRRGGTHSVEYKRTIHVLKSFYEQTH